MLSSEYSKLREKKPYAILKAYQVLLLREFLCSTFSSQAVIVSSYDIIPSTNFCYSHRF